MSCGFLAGKAYICLVNQKNKREKANKKFSELLEKVESYDDLSTEELTEVAKLQGVYAAQAFKSQGKKFKDSLKEIGAAMDGFLEGLDEGLDEAKEDSTEEKD